jgi:hypothetical protein
VTGGEGWAALAEALARSYHFEVVQVVRHPALGGFVVALVDPMVDEEYVFDVAERDVARGALGEAFAATLALQFRRARAQVDARVSFEPDVTYEASPAPASRQRGTSRFMSKAYGGWR